jgi:uncharacterized protein (UPF0371 family)
MKHWWLKSVVRALFFHIKGKKLGFKAIRTTYCINILHQNVIKYYFVIFVGFRNQDMKHVNRPAVVRVIVLMNEINIMHET